MQSMLTVPEANAEVTAARKHSTLLLHFSGVKRDLLILGLLFVGGRLE